MAPVRKALSYYTHMGKTMEEELKKEQVKKHSREETPGKVSSVRLRVVSK